MDRSRSAPKRRGRQLPRDLRLGDLNTFLVVQRCGSLAGAARELAVTGSQVSKSIARLERQLHLVLLSRSVRGVSLTDEALRILPHLEQAIGHFHSMVRADAEAETRQLTIAAPSYLISLFLPVIAECQPHLNLRGLELPPAMVRARTSENFFDVCLVTGRARLPPTWQAVSVGEISKGLLARPALARRLGSPPVKPERLLPIPFIGPVYSVNGQFVTVDDDCPLTYAERRQGHHTQTLAIALELATRTDQLVYGPLIAARSYIDDGRLVEVKVAGWRVSEPLAVACNTQSLLASEQRAIVNAVKHALSELSQAHA